LDIKKWQTSTGEVMATNPWEVVSVTPIGQQPMLAPVQQVANNQNPWNVVSIDASQIPGQRSTSVAQPEMTLQDRIMGAIETPAIIAGSVGRAITTPIVRMYGEALGGYGTPQGRRAGEEAAQMVGRQFYQPRTQTGPDIVESMSKVLGAIPPTPLTSAGTALSTLAGPAARQALRQAQIAAPAVQQAATTAGQATVQAPANVVRSVGNLLKSEDAQMAERLAEQIGIPKDELVKVLSQQGPQLIEGYQKTVPQIIQDPFLSQLQRNLKTTGVQNLGEAEKLQQQQMAQALARVAPSQGNVVDAAQRAGGAIEAYAIPVRKAASQNVRQAFESVDPFGETALYLPIPEMEQAAGKYLGAGTFGTGERANQAIAAAKRVGTEVLPEVKLTTQSQVGKSQNLEQAVRSMGGIRDTGYLSNELKELGRKQSGTTGLISSSGKDVEKMAELMHERGFIPDSDPALLLDALRNKGGRKTFAADISDNAFARQFETAMGEAPGREVIPKTVPFQTIQNLRSSIGEAARTAEAKGANKEAAALNEMITAIDSRINRAAGQSIEAGEYFPKEIADQYRNALEMHKAKVERFGTGPQVSMFRKGGDNQASIQGAEIPSKFYSGAMSQADDMKAFKKLVNSRTDLMDVMKSYAMTQAEGTRNATTGNLGDKYLKWLSSRSGANAELLNPSELATVNEVGKMVQNQMITENLGRVTGSDTAQKLATLHKNGMLDSQIVDFLANKIPVVKSVSGPILTSLRNASAQQKNEIMARLLANPEAFAKALKE
jgi:uncharacterized protein YidB (DUF937 family)